MSKMLSYYNLYTNEFDFKEITYTYIKFNIKEILTKHYNLYTRHQNKTIYYIIIIALKTNAHKNTNLFLFSFK